MANHRAGAHLLFKGQHQALQAAGVQELALSVTQLLRWSGTREAHKALETVFRGTTQR